MPRVLRVSLDAPDWRVGALDLLRAGRTMVVPTDTVYAAVAAPAGPRAVRRLLQTMAVPAGTDPPLLLASAEALGRFAAHNPPAARRLAAAFWPGRLTMVLRRAPGVRGEAAGYSETVTLRVPANAALRELISEAGGALLAIGVPGAQTLDEALSGLALAPSLALDGGRCPGGESSVVDCSRAPLRLLREGAIARERLASVARSRLY